MNPTRATDANDPAGPSHKRRALTDRTSAINPLYEKCGLTDRRLGACLPSSTAAGEITIRRILPSLPGVNGSATPNFNSRA